MVQISEIRSIRWTFYVNYSLARSGQFCANVSFSIPNVPCCKIFLPNCLNGESGSLKVLQSKPNAHDPIISVEKQAENK